MKMKMKKFIAVFLTAMSLMLITVGCNSNTESQEVNNTQQNEIIVEDDTDVTSEENFEYTDVQELSSKLADLIYESTSNQDFYLAIEGSVQEQSNPGKSGLTDNSIFEDMSYVYIIPTGVKNEPFGVTVGKIKEGNDIKKVSEEMKKGLLEHAEEIMISKPDEAEIVIKGDYIIVLLNDSKNPYDLKTDKLIKEFSKFNY